MHNIHTIESQDSSAVYKIQWDNQNGNLTIVYRQGKSYVHPNIDYDVYANLEDKVHMHGSVGKALAEWKKIHGKTALSIDAELNQLLDQLDPETKKMFIEFGKAIWQARNAT